jgi:acetyl-CoA acyltransferase
MDFAAKANPALVEMGVWTQDALFMGRTAENLHDRFPTITKERADYFALQSQQRANSASVADQFAHDIVSIETPHGIASADEQPRPGTTLEGLAALVPPFRPDGKVTAGNASPLTDGATMSLLAGEEAVSRYGLVPRMRMVSFAYAGVNPDEMGLGPIPSTEKALRIAGLTIDDIGIFELNEAFAVQVLTFIDHFDLDQTSPTINPWGGAIAIGHPLAASGVRLAIQLARHFEVNPRVRYGLTALCVGLGQGGSIIWENPHYVD